MLTNQVRVEAIAEYLPEQSIPENEQYVFAYHVKIHNEGTQTAQLVSRHWIMTNGDERTQELRGMGVIGVQPYIKPGETYQYSSGTVLDTVVGTMQGSYQMQAEDGTLFNAVIPAFSLAVPNQLH
ncbi:Co2+/Mg2+ efflux protein ApaG [Marinomonas agarivorans]|nr:Co2+/Mg2+ efflux protein ApaG [Marinomonas agarivorans]